MSHEHAQDSKLRPRIGRYVITARIGRGGMGMVYRGLDEALERETAVKTLRLEGPLDEESRRRFEVEAKAAARLQHPNIVTVYELGEDRGIPFIAMELLPGVDLESVIRSGEPIPLAEQLDVLIQVCRGLAFAHDRGVVHRDIKPSNIRLLDDGTAKIMDFGIAKLGGMNLTRSGMMVGTVHYMSPEQVRGGTLDGRSDVFSVGVILYELLCGRKPFEGDGVTEILYRIVHDAPPPIDVSGSGGPARLEAIIDKALAKDVALRYPTASALADDLAIALAEHQRLEGSGALTGEAADELSGVRKLLKMGDPQEAERRIARLLEHFPGSVDLRRMRRTARREADRRLAGPAVEDGYPELEGTLVDTPTRPAPGSTGVAPSLGALLPSRRGFALSMGLAVAAFVAVLAGGLTLLLLRRGPEESHIEVRSVPPGATVLLDGRETGVVTDGTLVVPGHETRDARLTFRRDGMRDEDRTVSLPAFEGASVSVDLQPVSPLTKEARVPVASEPAGATVTLDGAVVGRTPLDVGIDAMREHEIAVAAAGFVTHRVRVPPGPEPSPISVRLEPAGAPGTVVIASSYPVDVSWRGRVLAREQASASITVPAGQQTLTVSSATVFLRLDVVVDVAASGRSHLTTPGLGRLNVRALPDNCEVYLDGVFLDHPPVFDKAVAAGRRLVSYRWPDGTRFAETVDVVAGKSAFSTGRKE